MHLYKSYPEISARRREDCSDATTTLCSHVGLFFLMSRVEKQVCISKSNINYHFLRMNFFFFIRIGENFFSFVPPLAVLKHQILRIRRRRRYSRNIFFEVMLRFSLPHSFSLTCWKSAHSHTSDIPCKEELRHYWWVTTSGWTKNPHAEKTIPPNNRETTWTGLYFRPRTRFLSECR